VGVLTELTTKLAFDADDRAWMLEAKCLDADPEAFFPEKGGSTREAKRICAAVPGAQRVPGARTRARRALRDLGWALRA
jgi:hypothetical protein